MHFPICWETRQEEALELKGCEYACDQELADVACFRNKKTSLYLPTQLRFFGTCHGSTAPKGNNYLNFRLARDLVVHLETAQICVSVGLM